MDLALPWLATAAPVQPRTWELPYAVGVGVAVKKYPCFTPYRLQALGSSLYLPEPQCAHLVMRVTLPGSEDAPEPQMLGK